ncbi:hypothetical protein EBZ70_04770 [bacterium]|jgi:hypothetical protein|nr:hypothetical protein [bacterium]
MDLSEPANGYVRNWLGALPWATVEALNKALCAAGNATHGRSSEGYEKAKALWENARAKGDLHYADLVELCAQAHRASPFLFYNGNSFATIVRRCAQELPLGDVGKAAVRQAAGHVVAGVMAPEDSAAFLARLRLPPSRRRRA